MFGNVNESGTNMLGSTNGALSRPKKSVLATMNANTAQKSSRIMIKGALSVIFGDVNESGTGMPGSTNGALSRS